jgi:hypothetical protein
MARRDKREKMSLSMGGDTRALSESVSGGAREPEQPQFLCRLPRAPERAGKTMGEGGGPEEAGADDNQRIVYDCKHCLRT